MIFADEEYAILYECYGTLDEQGVCSDRVHIELIGRSKNTELSPERREQVRRTLCFESKIETGIGEDVMSL